MALVMKQGTGRNVYDVLAILWFYIINCSISIMKLCSEKRA